MSVCAKGFAYLLCWPRGRGVGLASTRRFSFHEFYNFLPFDFLILIFFFWKTIFLPTTFTHTHDPRPLPTTHDPRHLATLVHGTWSRISQTSHFKLKREVSRTEKRFKIAIMFSGRWRGMDLWKQMSSSKCSFTCICGIFLPLNPSTTTVYARSAFYPSLRFTLSLQSAFYPWSAVCSPQSAVCVLHWPVRNREWPNLNFYTF